jgi:hypothetical protein
VQPDKTAAIALAAANPSKNRRKPETPQFLTPYLRGKGANVKSATLKFQRQKRNLRLCRFLGTNPQHHVECHVSWRCFVHFTARKPRRTNFDPNVVKTSATSGVPRRRKTQRRWVIAEREITEGGREHCPQAGSIGPMR